MHRSSPTINSPPGNQLNPPVQQNIPTGQPKSPQPGAEAGLNPNTSVRHAEPEVGLAKRRIVAACVRRPEALWLRFQLASGPNSEGERSGQNYSPAKNNLECGVKILFNQTIVQHKPLLTWSS